MSKCIAQALQSLLTGLRASIVDERAGGEALTIFWGLAVAVASHAVATLVFSVKSPATIAPAASH